MSSISEGTHISNWRSPENLKFFRRMATVVLASIAWWLITVFFVLVGWFVVMFVVLVPYTSWLAGLPYSTVPLDIEYVLVVSTYGASFAGIVFTTFHAIFLLISAARREKMTIFPWHLRLKEWAYRGRSDHPEYLKKYLEFKNAPKAKPTGT